MPAPNKLQLTPTTPNRPQLTPTDRYLRDKGGDMDVRMLLHAFQLSLGACASHPHPSLLRMQMLARMVSRLCSVALHFPVFMMPPVVHFHAQH